MVHGLLFLPWGARPCLGIVELFDLQVGEVEVALVELVEELSLASARRTNAWETAKQARMGLKRNIAAKLSSSHF